MMNAPVALLAGMLLAATGCESSDFYWYRSDKTLEQAKEDYFECQRTAYQEAAAAASEEYAGRTGSPVRSPGDYVTDHTGSPLDEPFDSWSPWRGVYAQNVFAGCMKQKGYMRVPQHRLPTRARTQKFDLGAMAGR